MQRLIERDERMEVLTLDSRIYLPIGQFDGVLHQGFILRMPYTGRIDSTAVVLGKLGKILLDYGLDRIRLHYSNLQIVRHKCHRCTAIVVQCIFAGFDEVFLAL